MTRQIINFFLQIEFCLKFEKWIQLIQIGFELIGEIRNAKRTNLSEKLFEFLALLKTGLTKIEASFFWYLLTYCLIETLVV